MSKIKSKKGRKKGIKSNCFIDKKNIIFMVISILLVILLIIFLYLKSVKTIECTKTIGDKSILAETRTVFIKINHNKIKKIKFKKTLQFSEAYKTYIDIVKETLEKEYKNLNLKSNISRKDNILIINIESDEKYLLDNIDVLLSEDSVSINIISNYDLESVTYKNVFNHIMDLYGKNNYICK